MNRPSTPQECGWTDELAKAAEREGWFIAHTPGSDNGPWQFQLFDDPEDWPEAPRPYPFKSDGEVWEHIVNRALECAHGLHHKAYAVMSELNPNEFLAMQQWVGRKQHGIQGE